MSWNFKKFDELTNIELYNLLKERTLVFVVEQNCPYLEVDGKDPFSYHLFKEENRKKQPREIKSISLGCFFTLKESVEMGNLLHGYFFIKVKTRVDTRMKKYR